MVIIDFVVIYDFSFKEIRLFNIVKKIGQSGVTTHEMGAMAFLGIRGRTGRVGSQERIPQIP